MSPIPPRKRSFNILVNRGLFGSDDNDDDGDNYNHLGNWSEKSYNDAGSSPGGSGGSGSDSSSLNGWQGSEWEGNNIDVDIEDRVINHNNGIDGGKIAAIVVSIVVFFLLVTGLCFWKDRQRKKRRLAEEQTLADGGVKGDVYMKEQGEELSPVSAVSTQGVGRQAPAQTQGTREQDAPPPYEPRQPGVAQLAGARSGVGGSTWRQSRIGAEEDDIMVTDGIPPDSGRQQEGKGGVGLQIGS
ncbi:hypothetical protein B0T21DRAFT_345950 [Apiosordaria backusii]|uniref:Uncharacterized protein n=1 Tax=Apiosordaria backusii TaxID=314023 RepID=A0AA40K162_9PEZI|nr:hypothetical protein B0T21DRAFT_345950 [Apiosordaria backusii]